MLRKMLAVIHHIMDKFSLLVFHSPKWMEYIIEYNIKLFIAAKEYVQIFLMEINDLVSKCIADNKLK